MDLKKAESKKQGHCYSKREEADRHDTINIPVVRLFKVLKKMKMLCNHSGRGWAGWENCETLLYFKGFLFTFCHFKCCHSRASYLLLAHLEYKCLLHHCTEVCFASFLSGGITTMAVINPLEKKLAKRTSVHRSNKIA